MLRKNKWAVALKEHMGCDFKGLMQAVEEPSDWIDGHGKVVNPAQDGGGVVKGKLLDADVQLDHNPQRKDQTAWYVSMAIRQEVFQNKGRNFALQESQRSFLPEVRLPFVYKSQHLARDSVRDVVKALSTGVQAGDKPLSSQPPHPLQSGPSLLPEDAFSLDLEAERRSDAMLRLKFEVFTNRLQARVLNNQFSDASRQDIPKSMLKFFVDGDDLKYTHKKPIWTQRADQKKGMGIEVGHDLDSVRLRNLQRFIKRVATLGAPDSVGDVNRLLSEQRNLMQTMQGEVFSSSSRHQMLLSRREFFVTKRSIPPATLLRDTIQRETPLVSRIAKKRRRKLLPDEAHEDALAEVAIAKETLRMRRQRTKADAFGDDREKSFTDPGADPTQLIPEDKRATQWLALYRMPGDIEDPRRLNPFLVALSPSTPLTSELRGRAVAQWEANEGAGFPGYHKVVAEKVASAFDWQRASERIRLGLPEKAVADWRPVKSAEQQAFEDSVRMRGMFDRRPVGFWSRENPDLRLNKEWDDVLGAPFVADSNSLIDKNRFYELRVRWAKRKELAILWGLGPKPDETTKERYERRDELDKRLREAISEGDKDILAAWVSDVPGLWYGRRHFRDSIMDKTNLFPINIRPTRDLLHYQAMAASYISESKMTKEETDEVAFRRSWLSDDAAKASRRQGDSRVDYLSTAGRRRPRQDTAAPCMGYMQVQDALWEYRVYRGHPEPGPHDKTWLEDTTSVDMMEDNWWTKKEDLIVKELDAKLQPQYRSTAGTAATLVDAHAMVTDTSRADSLIGWKSPTEVDKWRVIDGCKEGLELHREMSFPVDKVNHQSTHRWLAKTPYDRIAANDLVTKTLRPEDEARPRDLGASYYFHRNRLHYHRLPVQRLSAYGAELREMKELSERAIPHETVKKVKNFYAVARHNIIPYFSDHVSKNGPKLVNTPKVTFDSIGLHDDLEDYIRVNPHLQKWDAM
ncbi:hypothetical protein DIPPA_31280 [Diplonema papillatum]|nr:hypothetical protein DIPPA_31280 [Diplonema papillatum]